jgi:hypothetical protein
MVLITNAMNRGDFDTDIEHNGYHKEVIDNVIKDLKHCGYSISDIDENVFNVSWVGAQEKEEIKC